LSQLALATRLRDRARIQGLPEPQVDATTVSRWESGRQVPSPFYRHLIAAVFDSTEEELGLDPASITTSTPSAAERQTRKLVTELSAVRANRSPMTENGKFSLESLDWIDARLSWLSRLDDLHGGRFCLGLADDSIDLVIRLIKSLPHQPLRDLVVERRLWRGAAEFARFAGWVAFDAGENGDASNYWRAATGAAAHAQDSQLLAYVLISQSLQAAYLGDGKRAVEFSQAAMEAVRQSDEGRLDSNVSSTVKALLATWQARAYGVRRNKGHVAELLIEADERWDQRNPEDDPDWITWVPLPSQTAEAGLALEDVGDRQTAERCLTQGLESLPADFCRDRVLYLIALAKVHLGQGRLDQAVSLATQAAVLAADTFVESTRTTEMLRAFGGQLPPGERGRAIQDLRERLQTLPR
jgi:tetratricopeptide (TPR) repeat protein